MYVHMYYIYIHIDFPFTHTFTFSLSFSLIHSFIFSRLQFIQLKINNINDTRELFWSLNDEVHAIFHLHARSHFILFICFIIMREGESFILCCFKSSFHFPQTRIFLIYHLPSFFFFFYYSCETTDSCEGFSSVVSRTLFPHLSF